MMPPKVSSSSSKDPLDVALDQGAMSRLWLFAVAACIIGILLLIFASFLSNILLSVSGNFPGFSKATIEAIGGSLISSGVVMFGFEIYVRRQISVLDERKSDSVVRKYAHHISDNLLSEIALGDPDRLSQFGERLNADQLEGLGANALGAAIGDPIAARALARHIVSGHKQSSERWRSLEIYMTLRPWMDYPERYLTVDIKCSFFTNVQPNVSALCYSDIGQYREAIAKQAVLWSWYLEPTSQLPSPSSDAFELRHCSVDGKSWKVTSAQEGGVIRFAASPEAPAVQSQASEYSVSVDIRVRVQRRGHSIWFEVPRICDGVQYSIDCENCGFRHMNIYPVFAAPGDAMIWSHPGAPARRFVKISDWVTPKAGVIFVWVLEEEFDNRFVPMTAAALKRVGVARSKPAPADAAPR